MSKIRIKNFGPIKEGFQKNDGWMDIKKVTIFIGNQGSGKSTVAKLISVFTWLEKALNRDELDMSMPFNDLNECLKYQRIENYYRDNTIIEYVGDAYSISTNKTRNHSPIVKRTHGNYIVPQIMYAPAERNILSIIQNAFDVKGLPGGLFDFAQEVKKAQFALNGNKLDLPIPGFQFRYDKRKDISYLVGNDYEINLLEASSGYQSLVPLYLVTQFLSDYIKKGDKTLREQLSPSQSVRRNSEIAEISLDDSLSDDEKKKKVKQVDAKYLSKCLINIVEEPEQNLFPVSQQQMLNSLLAFNNVNEGNKLLITTHSPYLINYLTLSVEAYRLKEKALTEDLKNRMEKIVPLHSTINPTDLAIYQLEEKDGTINLLPDYMGLPSDENKLNEELGQGNEDFAKLLEIQQKL